MGRSGMTVKKDYTAFLQALLPTGQAWNRQENSNLTLLLDAFAAEFLAIHNRALDLLKESDPRSTIEMLTDWETETGLPDSCSEGIATTFQERRQAILQKLTTIGGQSASYFRSIAEGYGYEVEITENLPFRVGESYTGEEYIEGEYSRRQIHLTDDTSIRFYWNAKVLEPRVNYFRCGESECGIETLATITQAEDLECILMRLKPAHTHLTFAYEGA